MSAETTSRTDIHRPASEEFDPAKYKFIDAYDMTWVKTLEATLAALGKHSNKLSHLTFATHQKHARCGHCGSRLRYAALLMHADTSELLLVGETCLEGRFTNMSKPAFQKIRKAALVHRKSLKAAALLEESCEKEPLLALLTYPEILDDHSSFVSSIAAQFKEFGVLSERQEGAVLHALSSEGELAHRLKKEEEDRVKREKLVAGEILLAPNGDTTITGVITKVELRSDRVYGTSSWKMSVKDFDGFRVWGTLPRRIMQKFLERNPDKDEQDIIGETILFHANLSASSEDAYFAFARKVTKVNLI